MAIVAGVDCETLSVRVSVVDSKRGDHGSGPARRARKRFHGVAACIHRSGDFRSSCTGCVRIHTVAVYRFSTARRSIASGGGI
jgi:hypothetical protein